MANKNKGLADFDLAKATKKLQKMASSNVNNFKMPPLPDFDIKNLDFKDAMDMAQKAQQGFEMI